MEEDLWAQLRDLPEEEEVALRESEQRAARRPRANWLRVVPRVAGFCSMLARSKEAKFSGQKGHGDLFGGFPQMEDGSSSTKLS